MTEWLNSAAYGEVTFLNIIAALLVFIASLIISKLISLQLRRSLKDKISKEHLELLVKLVSYGILIVALLWVLPTVGFELSGLMVAGGIVALAIGFASQSIIGNLISGLFLMGERPVKIGDMVTIDGNTGVVENIYIITTAIRTFDGLYVRIPNETVFTSTITNLSSNQVRRFEYAVGISYSDDADRAIAIIKGLIDEHPLALVNPSPQIYVDELGDNSVDIVVRVWAPSAMWFKLKTELLWKIKDKLESGNITIPFPQRVIWRGNESNMDNMEQS